MDRDSCLHVSLASELGTSDHPFYRCMDLASLDSKSLRDVVATSMQNLFATERNSNCLKTVREPNHDKCSYETSSSIAIVRFKCIAAVALLFAALVKMSIGHSSSIARDAAFSEPPWTENTIADL